MIDDFFLVFFLNQFLLFFSCLFVWIGAFILCKRWLIHNEKMWKHWANWMVMAMFSIDSFCFLTQWLYCSCQKTVEKNHPLSAFPCKDWTKTEKKNSESSEWTIAVCHCATAFITNCSIFFLSTSYGWLYCIIKSGWSASSIMCVAILSKPWN